MKECKIRITSVRELLLGGACVYASNWRVMNKSIFMIVRQGINLVCLNYVELIHWLV